MRRKHENVRANIRAFFLESLGCVVTADSLQKVAGTLEWITHVRELRDEEGYQILTHHDRRNLNFGEYLLETDKPLPSFDIDIPENIRDSILNNTNFACYMCGCIAGEQDPYDATKTIRLHIGHIIDKSMGGTDAPSNLRAICSVCNEGASNLTLNRPDAIKLIAQVRRAPVSDQLDVLEWLIRKFPKQAETLRQSSDPLESMEDKKSK